MGKFLFAGYYGYQNTGDDSFCAVASWGSKKYWNATEVSFWSSSVPSCCAGDRAMMPAKKSFTGYKKVAGLRAAFSNDHVVFFGGSVFCSNPSWTSFYSLLSMSAAIFPSVRISAVGVSLGPFKSKSDFDAIRSFLNRMVFIALRDERSFQIAKDMKLRAKCVKTFDPAVLLPYTYEQKPVKKNPSEKAVLGISLCHHERYVGGDVAIEKMREQRILQTLKLLAAKGDFGFNFFIFNNHGTFGDRELVLNMAEELKGCADVTVIPYSDNPVSILEKFRVCDAVLAVRLHAGIFSLTAEKPFLLAEYHKKCSDFLDDIGFDPKFRIPPEFIDPGEAAMMLEDILLNKKLSLHTVSLAGAQKMAMENFTQFPGAFNEAAHL